MTGERAPVEVLKVSATSKPVAVAGAIAGVIRSKGRVEVQAIGAGAINQAVKAIAISRGYVAPGGLDLVCIPAFIDISIDGEPRGEFVFCAIEVPDQNTNIDPRDLNCPNKFNSVNARPLLPRKAS